MLRNAMWIACFALIVGGCASDRTVDTVESSGGSSSRAAGGAAASSPTMSGEAPMSSPTASAAASPESSSMKQSRSSNNRIAAGVEEETLETCLARIPQDATAGQKMLADHTCRRDYGTRR